MNKEEKQCSNCQRYRDHNGDCLFTQLVPRGSTICGYYLLAYCLRKKEKKNEE